LTGQNAEAHEMIVHDPNEPARRVPSSAGLMLAASLLGATVVGCGGGNPSPVDGGVTHEASKPPDVKKPTDAGKPTLDTGSDAHVAPPAETGPPPCDCDVSQICVAHQCVAKGTTVAPTFAACTNPPCMNVYNNCPIPLWSHAIAATGCVGPSDGGCTMGPVPIDDGNVREIAPNAQYQYAGVGVVGGGRLYAYYQQPTTLQNITAPVSPYNQFVEMTMVTMPVTTDAGTPSSVWVQNYDISYVDYLSLPVSVQAENGCAATTCGSQFSDWTAKLQECPTALLNTAGSVGTCMGSYNYCITADGTQTYDQTKPYCSKMQTAHGYPGSAVYGGVFPNEPSSAVAFWDGVAGWNRGVDGGEADAGAYYVNEPFNDYAKMIHVDMGCRLAPGQVGVYAFSTDDHQGQSGFVECPSNVLNVVWCPYQQAGAADASAGDGGS
jgi:hypothetical protein